MLISNDKPKGDATHLWGWIKKTYLTKFILKIFISRWCNWGGLMMWMPFIMDRYRQERNKLVIKCKALNWVKTNNVFPKGSPWWVLVIDGIISWHCFYNHNDYKTRNIQVHRIAQTKGMNYIMSPLVTQSFWNMTLLNIKLKAFTMSS